MSENKQNLPERVVDSGIRSVNSCFIKHEVYCMCYHAFMSDVKPPSIAGPPRARWTFLTNHAHVLLGLTRDPSARVRDLAAVVGITERAVHQILSDLEDGGVIRRVRDGRRNRYEVDPEVRLRHPMETHHRVGELLALARDST